LYFLSLQNTQFINWFGVNIIQRSITFKNWVQIQKNKKENYKNNLQQLLLSYYGKSQNTLWKSICGILVKIGRIEFPNENPDFLKNIFSLCQVWKLLLNVRTKER
jgi:hypothetical protein